MSVTVARVRVRARTENDGKDTASGGPPDGSWTHDTNHDWAPSVQGGSRPRLARLLRSSTAAFLAFLCCVWIVYGAEAEPNCCCNVQLQWLCDGYAPQVVQLQPFRPPNQVSTDHRLPV